MGSFFHPERGLSKFWASRNGMLGGHPLTRYKCIGCHDIFSACKYREHVPSCPETYGHSTVKNMVPATEKEIEKAATAAESSCLT